MQLNCPSRRHAVSARRPRLRQSSSRTRANRTACTHRSTPRDFLQHACKVDKRAGHASGHDLMLSQQSCPHCSLSFQHAFSCQKGRCVCRQALGLLCWTTNTSAGQVDDGMLMRSCVQCKACATAEERRRRESRPQVGPDMMKSTKKCTRYGWHSLIPNLM